VAEYDSVPDVWQLLGLAYYSGGDLEAAEEVADHCAALLAKQNWEVGARGGGEAGRKPGGKAGVKGDKGKGGKGKRGGRGEEEEREEEAGGCDEVAAALEDLQAAIREAKGVLGGGEGEGEGMEEEEGAV